VPHFEYNEELLVVFGNYVVFMNENLLSCNGSQTAVQVNALIRYKK